MSALEGRPRILVKVEILDPVAFGQQLCVRSDLLRKGPNHRRHFEEVREAPLSHSKFRMCIEPLDATMCKGRC